MKTMSVTEFKAKCLSIIEQVLRTGEPVQLTRRGKPVAELNPPQCHKGKIRFGLFEGTVKIVGDIVAPFDDVEWEAMR